MLSVRSLTVYDEIEDVCFPVRVAWWHKLYKRVRLGGLARTADQRRKIGVGHRTPTRRTLRPGC